MKCFYVTLVQILQPTCTRYQITWWNNFTISNRSLCLQTRSTLSHIPPIFPYLYLHYSKIFLYIFTLSFHMAVILYGAFPNFLVDWTLSLHMLLYLFHVSRLFRLKLVHSVPTRSLNLHISFSNLLLSLHIVSPQFLWVEHVSQNCHFPSYSVPNIPFNLYILFPHFLLQILLQVVHFVVCLQLSCKLPVSWTFVSPNSPANAY